MPLGRQLKLQGSSSSAKHLKNSLEILKNLLRITSFWLKIVRIPLGIARNRVKTPCIPKNYFIPLDSPNTVEIFHELVCNLVNTTRDLQIFCLGNSQGTA